MFIGFGVGEPIVYWFLRIFLLIVLTYCGWGISYDTPKRYNKYAWFAGISYSLIQGLRWLRGADYPHYYNDIVTLLGQYNIDKLPAVVTDEPELLYRIWCTVFYYSNLPFWVAFVVYSALLMGGVLLVLRHYRKAAVWALPLFFILTPSAENLIRQYIAVSFILYAYYFYLSDKKKKMWISLCAVPLIHFSGIIAVIVFVISVYLPQCVVRKMQANWLPCLLVLLFLYCYYFWDSSNLSYLVDFLQNYVKLDSEKASNYVDYADRWFTDEGSISNVLGKNAVVISLLNTIVNIVTYVSIIVLGFFAQKKDNKLFVAFYFSYLAIIIKTIGGDIEMFVRFYNLFVVLMPLLIGVYMYNIFEKIYVRNTVIVVYILNFLWYGFLREIINTSMFGYGFVWDK